MSLLRDFSRNEEPAHDATDGWALRVARQEYENAVERSRPSAIFRPTLGKDGNMWCALYGSNLMEGVSGFGESPDLAMHDFDRNWCKRIEATPVEGTEGRRGQMISETRLGELADGECANCETMGITTEGDRCPSCKGSGESAPDDDELRELIACARFVQALEPDDWDHVLGALLARKNTVISNTLRSALKALRERI